MQHTLAIISKVDPLRSKRAPGCRSLFRASPVVLALLTLSPVASAQGFGPQADEELRAEETRRIRSEDLREKYGIDATNLKRKVLTLALRGKSDLLDRVRQAFLDYIEDPEQIHVDVGDPGPSQLIQARFPVIDARFRNGLFEDIRITRAIMRMENAVLDYEELLLHERLRMKKRGKASFVILVQEEPINQVLLENAEDLGLEDPHLDLRRDHVVLAGTGKGPFGRTDFKVRGAFEVKNGSQIHFDPDRVKLGILPIPGAISRAIFERLNPIADLEKMNVYLQPELIVSRPGRLYFLTKDMMGTLEELEKEHGSR